MKRNIISIENRKVFFPANAEIWMTQYEIASLFECFVAKINANLRSILKSGVLDDRMVCRTYHYKNGNSVEQYNLEMIIALSFRIRSRNAEIFRVWVVRKAFTSAKSQVMIIGNWSNIQLN